MSKDPSQTKLTEVESTDQNIRYGHEFRKCKNILSRKESLKAIDALEEIAKIVTVKVVEEKNSTNRFNRSYLEESTIDRFNDLLADAVSELPELSFDAEVRIRHESTLLDIVDIFSDFDFTSKSSGGGDVYQVFIRESLRDEFGQFFTPKEIGEFLVELQDPDADDRILDPSAGPAGFLVSANDYLEDRQLSQNGDDIFGVEVEPTIHELAVLNYYIHDMDTDNMILGDSLTPDNDGYPAPVEDGFDVILANPPFSIKIDDSNILDGFRLGRKGHQASDILFAEKCVQLLNDDNGRFGIVLPEGFLNTDEYRDFREFLLGNCSVDAVISLPAGAFVPFGKSMARTCLIFGSTGRDDPAFDGRVFMGEAEEIGYECGKTDYVQIDANDLQNFLDLIDTDVPEGTIHNTDAGGRAAWVSDDLLKPDRLDPRNYFQKIQTVNVDIDAENRRLGDIADIIQNRMTPSDHPDEEFVYLEIPEMRDETGMVDRYTTTKGSEINSRKVKFEGGDLIFSRINPLKNRITVVPPHIDEGVTSSEMYIIRPKNGEEVTKYYLYRFLKSEAAMEYIRNHVTGSSSSRHRINKGDLRDMEVPYPSIEQQKQIAEPIRDGFTDLWSAYRKFFDAHEETNIF